MKKLLTFTERLLSCLRGVKKMLRVSAFKLVIATTIGLLLIASSASAGTIDPFTVYVGYADNLRASGFFPNPWIGVMFNGQSVTSQTNPAGMSFDAGAVRIDNPGTTSMQITNFEVTDNNGSVLFAIWGAGVELTLAPGQTGFSLKLRVITSTPATRDFSEAPLRQTSSQTTRMATATPT